MMLSLMLPRTSCFNCKTVLIHNLAETTQYGFEPGTSWSSKQNKRICNMATRSVSGWKWLSTPTSRIRSPLITGLLGLRCRLETTEEMRKRCCKRMRRSVRIIQHQFYLGQFSNFQTPELHRDSRVESHDSHLRKCEGKRRSCKFVCVDTGRQYGIYIPW